MKYFKIADIGFAIGHANEGREPGLKLEQKEELEIGSYLELFQTAPDEYEKTKDRVNIRIVEEVPEVIDRIKDYKSYELCQREGRNIIISHYGHYYQAVTFHHKDWYRRECPLFVAPGVGKEAGFTMNKLLSVSGMHSAFLSRGALVLHASYILTPQGAILFTAPSQTGKSTQARLWEQLQGAEIINGDRVILRKKDEQWYAYGYSLCGSSDICKNRQAPLRAIVVLGQSKENQVRPMGMAEKYRALLLASAVYSWDMEQVNMADEIITNIIKETNIVKLVCRPDEEAVHALENYLREVETCQ